MPAILKIVFGITQQLIVIESVTSCGWLCRAG